MPGVGNILQSVYTCKFGGTTDCSETNEYILFAGVR